MNALLQNPKKTLVALTTVLAAAGVAVGSGATFNSASANPTNTFTTGTLTQSNSSNGVAIVTGTNMKPGDTKTGTVTIKNTGSLKGIFKVTESNVKSTFSAGVLTLKVEDVTNAASPVVVYSGDFAGLASKDLGTFAAGEQHVYKASVTLDSAATNVDQAKTASMDLTFDEAQQAGAVNPTNN